MSFALPLGAVGIVLLIRAAFRLRQTTLIAPVLWGIGSVALLTWSCVCAASPAWPYWRYSAAALVIAPTLAQLGAKRPQNAAWQFIVLTLVGILLLPVFQGWAYGDEQPHVHGLFRWLLVVHVFVGVGNYLFTRYAPAALLFGCGQLALIAEYLPLGNFPPSPARELLGLGAIALAILAAFGLTRVGAKIGPRLGIDRLWQDFRNAFGAVWTLRIAERLNAEARQHRWPVEFAWAGVVAVAAEPGTSSDLARLDPALQHRIERELRSYLRRFVSHDWISARLPPGRD